MIQNESSIFGVDVDALVRVFRDEVKHDLRILAEYDDDSFEHLYVSDEVLDEYGGEGGYLDRMSTVESFLRTDLLERDAYTALVPQAGEAHLFVTQTENQLFVRIFDDDRALFACVADHGPVDTVVEKLEDAIDAH